MLETVNSNIEQRKGTGTPNTTCLFCIVTKIIGNEDDKYDENSTF